MKIVHIAPNAPYNDYWGYQENLLPKYQRKLEHDVTLIVPNLTHKDGKVVETDCADYVLNDGVRVVRLAYKRYFHRVLTGLHSRLDVLPYLKEIRPDFIFFHGLGSSTIFAAIEYKKRVNPDCVIVQDNHADYYNSGGRSKLQRAWYRRLNRKAASCVARVYGVTPWRKTFAEDYYQISPEKTDVLVMGADDEFIDFERSAEIRAEIRTRLNVAEDEFLVVTGGKLDKPKKIDAMMEAVKRTPGVKLLIFGKVDAEIQADFDRLLAENDRAIYIGWLDSNKVYDYFFASDLALFPVQHSVLWEQACAAKIPGVFAKLDGMDHVDVGGNADFIDEPTVEKIAEKIEELRFTEKYRRMKAVAQSEKTDVFLYSKIAEASLVCAQR